MRCSCEFDPNQRPVSICNYHDAAFKFTAKKAMEKERARAAGIIENRAAQARARGAIDLAVAVSGIAREIRESPGVPIHVAILDPAGRNLVKP